MYVVRVGRAPGIYETWEECKEQVNKYPGAEYKKVRTRQEAEDFLAGVQVNEESGYGYYIDGSYVDRVKGYGYAVVIADKKVKYQECGTVPDEFKGSRNVGPEFYAAIRALEIISEIGSVVEPVIYYDYEGVAEFIKGWVPRTRIATTYKMMAENILNNTGAEIRFHKVDAHSGNQYNELADMLAKQGALIKKGKARIESNLGDLK